MAFTCNLRRVGRHLLVIYGGWDGITCNLRRVGRHLPDTVVLLIPPGSLFYIQPQLGIAVNLNFNKYI